MILQARLRAPCSAWCRCASASSSWPRPLHGANAQLHALATVDALTGLLNRRALDTRLRQEMDLARAPSSRSASCCATWTSSSSYNDSLGHGAGDACLKQVANVFLQACRRPSDCAARYGGARSSR